MSDFSKMAVTVAMWIAVGIIDFGVALSNIEQGNALGWAFALPLIIAFLGTAFIWTVPALIENRSRQQTYMDEKTKRQSGDLMAIVMGILNEDERRAFKDRLQQRALDNLRQGEDGEIPGDALSLGALLDEEVDQRQQYQ